MPKPALDCHFKSLFEYAPISLWEEDYSAIKLFFDALRAKGIVDLNSYLDQHPEEIADNVRRIKVKRVNAETLRMFRAKNQDELISNLGSIFRGEMDVHFRDELLALWNGKHDWSGEGINYTLSGEALHIRLYWRILPECAENWSCVMVSIEDITALKKAETRAQKLFKHAPISLWEEDYTAIKKAFDALRAQGVTDLKRYLAANPEAVRQFTDLIRVLDVNQKTLDLFEAADKETLLANLKEVFHDDMGEHFQNELVDMWEGKTYFERESVNYSLHGKPVNVHIHWTLMPGHENDFAWVLVALQDITARKKAEDYLRYLGTHDAMTGLYNRAFFEEVLHKLEASRIDPTSFIIADLNGLKRVNDSFGHSAGDQLIRRAAEVLKASIEDRMIAARIGGDEFIIILPGEDAQKSKEMIERIDALTAINNKYYRNPPLSFSLGASTSAPGASLLKFVSLADDDMYKNKGVYYNRRKKASYLHDE
ncbi:MAG: hypothetical protein B6D38_08395 [Anaerolineae bacterium UTCFX1]|nr:MAG: hypothetical protein B6D38_08395 [Anaerolineae bacterium UTCFX1]